MCVNKQIILDSDDGLSPGWRQAIIWTNDGILSIRTLETNFSEILSEIQTFSLLAARQHLAQCRIYMYEILMGTYTTNAVEIVARWTNDFFVNINARKAKRAQATSAILKV